MSADKQVFERSWWRRLFRRRPAPTVQMFYDFLKVNLP